MNRFKYEAFLEEFPFLDEIMAEHRFQSENLTGKGIVVKRADDRLLSLTPLDSGYDCCQGQRWNRTAVHFITTEILLHAVFRQVNWQYADQHTSDFKKEGETILEAIFRHNVAPTLKLIIGVHRSGCDFGDTPETNEITIYKTPKDVTYDDLIKEAQTSAISDIKAEVEFAEG